MNDQLEYETEDQKEKRVARDERMKATVVFGIVLLLVVAAILGSLLIRYCFMR